MDGQSPAHRRRFARFDEAGDAEIPLWVFRRLFHFGGTSEIVLPGPGMEWVGGFHGIGLYDGACCLNPEFLSWGGNDDLAIH